MTLLPKVKLKALVSFPATVLDGTGIDVAKSNGTYQFNLDFADFAPPVTGLTDSAHQNALLWNSTTGSYVLAPITLFGGSGGIPDAPVDGVLYGRRSATWAPVLANPTTTIGLTAVNGVATAAIRSDGSPALSQAIVPTWTAKHTFTSTAGGVEISGNPNITVSNSTVHPYFISDSKTAQLLNTVAISATLPETGFQSVVNSAVGSGNLSTAFKIAGFFAATGAAGTADVYGGNFVGQLSSGASSATTGIALEADFNANNAHYGDTSGNPTSPYAVPLYIATGGSNRVTSYILVAGGGSAGGGNRGLTFQAGTPIRLNVIEDYSTVSVGGFVQTAGSYPSYVINLQPATGTYTSAILFPNNKSLTWRNAANSADIATVNVNASNDLVLGATGIRSLTFAGARAGGYAATITNTNAAAADAGILLGCGSNGAADTTSIYMQFATTDLANGAGTIQRADAAGVRHVAYATASDERLKTSRGLLDNALERVARIKVHKYTGADYKGDDYNVGFFAQNLYKAYPWAVTPSDDPDFKKNPWSVDYGAVTPLLIRAVQELSKQIEDLKHELKKLNG